MYCDSEFNSIITRLRYILLDFTTKTHTHNTLVILGRYIVILSHRRHSQCVFSCNLKIICLVLYKYNNNIM